MASTSVQSVDQRKLRERLSLWDSQKDPKAPLSTFQKDVLIELTNFANDRPFPQNVGHFRSLFQAKKMGGGGFGSYLSKSSSSSDKVHNQILHSRHLSISQ